VTFRVRPSLLGDSKLCQWVAVRRHGFGTDQEYEQIARPDSFTNARIVLFARFDVRAIEKYSVPVAAQGQSQSFGNRGLGVGMRQKNVHLCPFSQSWPRNARFPQKWDVLCVSDELAAEWCVKTNGLGRQLNCLYAARNSPMVDNIRYSLRAVRYVR